MLRLRRFDLCWRDVTDLPGLWDESDLIVLEGVDDPAELSRSELNRACMDGDIPRGEPDMAMDTNGCTTSVLFNLGLIWSKVETGGGSGFASDAFGLFDYMAIWPDGSLRGIQVTDITNLAKHRNVFDSPEPGPNRKKYKRREATRAWLNSQDRVAEIWAWRSASLIKVERVLLGADGRLLWSERFDGSKKDFMALEGAGR